MTIFVSHSILTSQALLSRALPGSFARGLPPNGFGFLVKGSAGRAKLLLSRIPAASVSSITLLPKNAGKRSQRGPAFGGSAGASPSRVFARPLTEFQRTSTPLGLPPGGIGVLSITTQKRLRRAGDVNPPVTVSNHLANVAAGSHYGDTRRLTSTARIYSFFK
ncbi:MAG UNVERIFIED_CONTAM: hypothetical protein LVR18_30145 [Planctomycetaceae bacterium]|jgi:hypothetical protein